MDTATLGIVLALGIITALNPSSTGFLLMVMSSIYGKGHNQGRLILHTSSYLLGTFLASLSASVVLWILLSAIPFPARGYVALFAAAAFLAVGLVEIRNYFWYGKRLMLTPHKSVSHQVHSLAIKMKSAPGYLVLGFASGLILLPYIGMALIALLVLFSLSPTISTLMPLVLLSAILLIPSIFLLLCLAMGVKMSVLTKWKEDSKATMRLTSGLAFVLIGWVIALVANGTVRIG